MITAFRAVSHYEVALSDEIVVLLLISNLVIIGKSLELLFVLVIESVPFFTQFLEDIFVWKVWEFLSQNFEFIWKELEER